MPASTHVAEPLRTVLDDFARSLPRAKANLHALMLTGFAERSGMTVDELKAACALICRHPGGGVTRQE